MRAAIERFLEGFTPARRALLSVFASVPFMAVFLVVHHHGLTNPEVRPGLAPHVMWPLQGCILLGMLVTTATGLWLWPRRRAPDARPVAAHVLTLTIGLTYTLITIAAGLFTAGPNLVMLGILTVGMLLFPRRVMLVAYVVCVSLMALSELAVMQGWMRYAPALTPLAFDGTRPAWWWDVWRTLVLFVGMIVVAALIMVLFSRLDNLHARLRHLSVTDPLTGLSNRRFFMDRLEAEVRRQRRGQRPLAVVLIDADHFKRVNDRHGHPVGDQVLMRLAAAMTTGLRLPTDVASRLGGEEFALLLPDTTLDEAEAVCWRLQRRLAGERFQAGGEDFRVTVSMGVVETLDHEAGEILRQADRALYEAKASGRDRAVYLRMTDSAAVEAAETSA